MSGVRNSNHLRGKSCERGIKGISLQEDNDYEVARVRRANSFAPSGRLGVRDADSPAKPTGGRSRVACYGLALASVLAAASLRWALNPVLGDRVAYLPFAVVILAVALWCGPLPAVLASLMAFGFGLHFSGFNGFSAGDIAEAATFVFIAAGIVLLGEAINRAMRRARASDIEADRRAQEALHIAEELNLLIDGAQGHAIYMLDATGHVTIWNKGAERLKGWTESEVLGKPTSLFYPSDALAAGKPEADLLRARTEGRFEEEDWRLRKDGTEFLAAVSITALVDRQGKLRGFAKIVSDITEKRAAEDIIRWRESHLSSILSTIPDAMIVIDEKGIMLSFSKAAEALFGYSEDEVIGENVKMLMPPADKARHDGYIRRYLDTGEKRIIGRGRVVFAARKDGSTFPMELSIGEAGGDGTQRIFTGFIRDLTERHRTEERLEDLQSELIHVSRVSAMGTMASTLAHELNQPIAAIANYVEAVRDQLEHPVAEDFPMMREALDDAAKDALRAGHIVRRLRDFVARGEVERSVEPLPALINDASVLGLMGARERGIETRFDLDPYASPVFVDRVQIQQVLINLVRNACEAMEGCLRRELTVTSRPEGKDFVRVTVADTGSGIPAHIESQLFTAFVSSKQEGMGLGLSICRTIVEANEGRIWMERREGGGTNFHFTLPRAQMEEGHEQH